ncbi:MAG: InlB B-repeat-containing protein [Bacilli bacterium]|nr:InlB B-repeat-containing protein [Bacilli bacterium]
MMKIKNKGFTLVELLATIVILGIVVLIAIPAYSAISNTLKKRQNKNIFSYIETQASKYASENNLYSDIDQTSITVQTLLQNGYIEADNKAGTKVIDAFGNDITCYQVRIDFENGKPIPKFIDEKVQNQDGVCILDDLKVKKLIQLDAYKASSLTEGSKITVENNRTFWVKEDVVLKLKILDANLNARRNEQIVNINWDAVNENKNYSNKDANWTTIGWLDNITSYNQATEYKNVYRVSTSTIMNDTKFKISLTVNYIDDAGKKINETLTTYLVVRIDKELPTVTASVDTNWTKANKKIFITGNDKQGSGIDYFCIYDNEATNHQCSKTSANAVQLKSKSTNKAEVSKPVGTYYIWAVDKVGNWSLNAARVVVGNIDTTGPNCVYENQNTTWKSGAHTIIVKCDDGANGSGCVTRPYEAAFPDDGKTYGSANLLTSYIITDYAGNKTTCSGPANVYIDNKAPTLSVSFDGKKTATITASDTAGLLKYEIIKDSNIIKTVNLSGTSSTTTYEQNVAGTYTVKLYDITNHTTSKKYTINSYTVTFAVNNSSMGSVTDASKAVNYGETASTTFSAKAGYKYKSVSTGCTVSGTTAKVASVTADTTCTITFEPITYTVKLNANGGEGTQMSNISMTYNTAKALTANTYTRSGYIFTGWSTSSSDTSKLYDTGEYSGSKGSSESGYSDFKQFGILAPFAAGEVYQLDVDVKGSGKLVNYFYGDTNYLRVASWQNSNGSTGTNTDGSNQIPLTSSYTHYSVRFTLSSTGDGSVKKYILFRAFPGCSATIKNVRLKKVSSGSNAYEDGQSVKNLTTSNGSTVNLYAVWSPLYYLDLNGVLDGSSNGSIDGFGTADVYVNGVSKRAGATDYCTQWPSGTNYEIKNIKTATGKVYVGSSSYSGIIDNARVSVGLPFNTNFRIYYTLDGGSASNTSTYTIASNNITLANPTKANYTFVGWTGGDVIDTGLTAYTTSSPYNANTRDTILGNEFSVSPGRVYRVFVTAKRTKGSLNMRGGLVYTAQSSGNAWDGHIGDYQLMDTLSDGYGRYYKDVVVPAGKSKARFYVQMEQTNDNITTTWNLADISIVDLTGTSNYSTTSPNNNSTTYYGPYYKANAGYYRVDIYGTNLDKATFNAYENNTSNVVLRGVSVLSSTHAVAIVQAVGNATSSGIEIAIPKANGVTVTNEIINALSSSVTIAKGSKGNKSYMANWIKNCTTLFSSNGTNYSHTLNGVCTSDLSESECYARHHQVWNFGTINTNTYGSVTIKFKLNTINSYYGTGGTCNPTRYLYLKVGDEKQTLAGTIGLINEGDCPNMTYYHTLGITGYCDANGNNCAGNCNVSPRTNSPNCKAGHGNAYNTGEITHTFQYSTGKGNKTVAIEFESSYYMDTIGFRVYSITVCP